MLAGSHILSTFRCKDTVRLIMPVTDINNVYHRSPFRIRKNSILHIFGCTQCYFGFFTGFRFPFGDDIQPKLYKVQRTCKFRTCQLNDIRIIGKVIQTLTDVLSVQLTTYRMSYIIKHICYEDSLVTGKRNRFRESGLIDIVAASPRTIHPMCPSFYDIMLEVVFVK